VDADRLRWQIEQGLPWLVAQQNPDGGFGDTDRSHSNIATTLLAMAAIHLCGAAPAHAQQLSRAEAYVERCGRWDALRARYGIDKTFVVPILTNLALAGLADWSLVDPLPFELACVPQRLYRFVGLPVVSYAVPALVAIGQARFLLAPPRSRVVGGLRRLALARSLSVLQRMQPASGGYLEATPLTSFVVMSLAASSAALARVCPQAVPTSQAVLRAGVRFLLESMRPDGSWPIDTNLATWNTSLAIQALASAGEDVAQLLGPEGLAWLLACQHRKRHPFTGAQPGGFGWSDLAGAVPDADDTPGALLALAALVPPHPTSTLQDLSPWAAAVPLAVRWLLDLQNADGGWPTFCRGYGRLPFDRSGTDLTAHALRALAAWEGWLRRQAGREGAALARRIAPATQRGLAYLRRQQRPDGSWVPLWFGHQDAPGEENPVYGTAKVLMALGELGQWESPAVRRAVAWLLAQQRPDGSFTSAPPAHSREPVHRSTAPTAELAVAERVSSGKMVGPPEAAAMAPPLSLTSPCGTIEETALALEALLTGWETLPGNHRDEGVSAALARGLTWLVSQVEQGKHREAAPIGLYFAKLWYYEELYPLTFTVAALGRACRQQVLACLVQAGATPAPA
jgi:squalene-hopene/tetraprenyl-beta-curcumene cyclase